MLSVVIPAYNEEQMISKAASVICGILTAENIDFELLFINDGSKDNTWKEICEASQKDSVFLKISEKSPQCLPGLQNPRAIALL